MISKEELLERARRVAARGSIEQLINRYTQYFPMCKTQEIRKLFAEREDSRVEMQWGIYEGYESICRLFGTAIPDRSNEPRETNELHILPAYAPAIEIAGDGKTARAIWFANGSETGKPMPESMPESFDWDRLNACWSWHSFGADFILQDREWKFWHLHDYNIMLTDFYKSFADGEARRPEELFPSFYHIDGAGKPDREPGTVWNYTYDAVYSQGHPEVPEPYYSFDEIGYGY